MRQKNAATHSQQKNKDFSILPNWIMDSGVWFHLKGSDIKVLGIIIRHSDYVTGVSYIGVRKIQELSGASGRRMSRGTIASSTERLKSLGVIEKKRTGGRFSFKNAYRIIKNPVEAAFRTCPSNVDKRKQRNRDNKGRFNRICPSNMDKACPSPTDNKRPSITDTCIGSSNMDKNETYQNNKDQQNAGSALACQGQASPASALLNAYIGQVLGHDDLRNLLKLHCKDEAIAKIRSGEIKLAEGINLDDEIRNGTKKTL